MMKHLLAGLSRLTQPYPLRLLALAWLDRRFNILPYASKLNVRSIERPEYGHPLLESARLAHKLGHSRISTIEFGVAGGNGLLALERHAEYVQRETGVEVSVFGFDTGSGMPPPVDYRDLPYLFQPGYFRMDVAKLKATLTTAELILGPVEKTVVEFCQSRRRPPIGFIAFDLDYYSSTVAALRILDADHSRLLPRVACYFDDMVGDIDWAYNEFTGELLAIKEFNDDHTTVKIAPVNGLRHFRGRVPRLWHEQIFVAHLFQHPDYGRPTSDLTQLPLLPQPARAARRESGGSRDRPQTADAPLR
jgi:hypothetical protein